MRVGRREIMLNIDGLSITQTRSGSELKWSKDILMKTGNTASISKPVPEPKEENIPCPGTPQ